MQEKDGQSHQQEVVAAFARRDRDRAVKALREELRHARHFLDRAGGSEVRHGLGEGLSWMAPHFLVRLGEQTVVLLGRYAEGETPATLASPAALAAAVGEKTAVLERALEALNPERIQETVSRHETKIENQEAEKTIRRTAAFLGELYKLAGCEDFAEKVRPAFRRRRKPKQESESMALVPLAPPLPVEAELVREEPRIELRLVAGNEEQVLRCRRPRSANGPQPLAKVRPQPRSSLNQGVVAGEVKPAQCSIGCSGGSSAGSGSSKAGSLIGSKLPPSFSQRFSARVLGSWGCSISAGWTGLGLSIVHLLGRFSWA